MWLLFGSGALVLMCVRVCCFARTCQVRLLILRIHGFRLQFYCQKLLWFSKAVGLPFFCRASLNCFVSCQALCFYPPWKAVISAFVLLYVMVQLVLVLLRAAGQRVSMCRFFGRQRRHVARHGHRRKSTCAGRSPGATALARLKVGTR